MLLELTPDECRFLLGLLKEQLGEIRAEITKSDDEHYVSDLKRESIHIERIIHRLSGAQDPAPKTA